jgi:hypothetical protein
MHTLAHQQNNTSFGHRTDQKKELNEKSNFSMILENVPGMVKTRNLIEDAQGKPCNLDTFRHLINFNYAKE